jgi:hypothetical protein
MITPRFLANTIVLVFFISLSIRAQATVNITGKVTDNFSTPVQGVVVALKNFPAISGTTDSTGTYALSGVQAVIPRDRLFSAGDGLIIRGNSIKLTLSQPRQHVRISIHSLDGKEICRIADRTIDHGSYRFDIPRTASSVSLVAVGVGAVKTVIRRVFVNGVSFYSAQGTPAQSGVPNAMAKSSGSSAAVDTLAVSKTGYEPVARGIDVYTGTQDFMLLRSTVTYTSSTVALAVKTSLTAWPAYHTGMSNYGINPSVILLANSDNSFDVGVYASTTKQIQIIPFDSNSVKGTALIPSCITGATTLVGLAKIPDDQSFVAGYATTNTYSDTGFEYWITRFSTTGTQVFSTRIFGDHPKTEPWSLGEPGTFSSGRMMYNPTTKKIGFYCGHTMLWLPDSVRHQAGFVGFINLTGAFDTANSWFYSHDFDMRMLVVDSSYFLLAHGDAYPRALGFSRWNDVSPRPKKLVDSSYYTISGPIGDNTTRTQTGGFVRLTDGNFGVLFSSRDSSTGAALRYHKYYDLCYKKISPAGKTLSTAWLTDYPDTTVLALYPRIANWGSCVLVAWEELKAKTPTVQVQVIDNNGNTLVAKKALTGALLSPFYDFTTIPKGDILWATVKGTDSLTIYRIAR